MNNQPQPIRAPQDAIAWTPRTGFVYDDTELPEHIENGDVVLVVSDDGYLRGVTPNDSTPLAATLRIDADLAEVVQRLDEPGGR